MKLTYNGLTFELSDTFSGSLTINGIKVDMTPGACTTPPEAKVTQKYHFVSFSWVKGTNRIPAIKAVREMFCLGLGEAKEIVDRAGYDVVGSKTAILDCKTQANQEYFLRVLRECGYSCAPIKG